MKELIKLLTDWHHWAFEVISGGVMTAGAFVIGSIIPDSWNPVKRWIKRHDREHHNG